MTSADSSGVPRIRPLSLRRQEVARLVARAWLDKQIAAALELSEGQVRRIVSEIADAWHLDRHRSIRVQIATRYVETHETNLSETNVS